MRYSYEFKLECIEMYNKGVWPKTPDGTNTERFRKNIRQWVRTAEQNGLDSLKRKQANIIWTPEMKYELVAKVIAGNSRTSVAVEAGVSSGLLYSWVRKYREFGYNGLVNKKKGRKSSKHQMSKKSINPNPLTESEREELIRLREENEYIKTEIAVLKKLEALRHEKTAAAQLKAKKQQSPKNYESRDID